MSYYAVIYTMVDIERNNANRAPHVEFLKNLLREGKVESGWKFPQYEPGAIQGVLICKADSKETVSQWFSQDPVIVAGARTCEVRAAEPLSMHP